MSLIIIAMMDMNNGLGDAEGKLLFNLPKDMARFKSLTTGKHVVMGRKTWDSLPVKPLPRRKNYVLTRDESFDIKGKTKVFNSTDEVINMAKSKDVYIIGGAEIYKEFLPHADKMILTYVHEINMDARTFFPDFSLREWEPDKSSMRKQEADEKHKQSFTFITYNRIANS
jgi:dihydrofolate reductase